MKEEESDKQQIMDAEADYKAGRFGRVRALVIQGEKALISLIRDEISAIDKDIIFGGCERTLYFNYCNLSLNLYLEDGTFALIRHDLDGAASEKELKYVLAMAKIVKTYGFRERET